MALFLRLLAVVLLLLGGVPIATAGFSATRAPLTEEEHHSERADAPIPARAPARAETDSALFERGPRVPQPRWLTRRAVTPALAVRGARADRLPPLRC